MWISRSIIIIALLVSVMTENYDDIDVSSTFMEVANSFLTGISTGSRQFADPHVATMPSGGAVSVDQIISGLRNLLTSTKTDRGSNTGSSGLDLSMLTHFLQMIASRSPASIEQRASDSSDRKADTQTFNMAHIMNIANMFVGSDTGNYYLKDIMKYLPMLMNNVNSAVDVPQTHVEERDHSAHSWYVPPIIENFHIIWEHFRNSELGIILWKNSGLAHTVGIMTDTDGRIQYELILNSFETPSIRRRWIRLLTNFVASWISHISDPNVQQRYFATMQLIGNSFLKSQGFPKSILFDSTKPVESFTKVVNAGAKRYLDTNLNSMKYIKPTLAYVQDLIQLASRKGFIMSRINANELSNRLSDTINNDIVSPILKTYRAYKWAIKSPKCATHIMCVINDKAMYDNNETGFQRGLTKIISFPAAWAITAKTNISFWNLCSAIHDSEQCYEKYPANCKDFHEEEIRVTTESIHSEL